MSTPQPQYVKRDLIYPSVSALGGTGLKASSDISTGDTIIQVRRPLIVALDTPRLKDTCYNCFDMHQRAALSTSRTEVQPINLKLCSSCKTVRYCSRDCQKESWDHYHKHECHLFQDLHPRILPSNVRGIVQFLILQRKNKLNGKEWESFLRLESHIKDFEASGGKTWENLELMARAAHKYSATELSVDDVVQIVARVMINCFTLITESFDPIGVILHPLPSSINHSCDFNAYIRCDRKGSTHVIALKPIGQDDEVTISYIDPTYPTRIRKKELQERYFFDCTCRKCRDPFDCDFDHSTLTDEKTREILAIEARVAELLASAQQDSGTTAPLQKLEYALHLLHGRDWPLHQQPFPQIRHDYIITLMAAGQYNAAFAQAAIQKSRVDPKIMPQSHHPLVLIHRWVLIRLITLIMGGTEWASQSVDLRKYDLNLPVLRAGLLREAVIMGYEVLSTDLRRKINDTEQTQRWRDRHAGEDRALVRGEWAKVTYLEDDELDREKNRKWED